MIRFAVCLLGLCQLSNLLSAQDAVANPEPSVASQDVYRLGVKIRALPDEGMFVETVLADGPATRLRRNDNPGVEGKLDPGDVITAIDGTAVRSMSDYERAMGRAGENAGRVKLTVKDVRSGALVDWEATARRVRVDMRSDANGGPFGLGFSGEATGSGLKIQQLFQNSPLLQLSDDAGQSARADIGDVITSINGSRIQNLEQYQAEMEKLNGQGQVRIVLKDIRTGREKALKTRAERQASGTPQPLVSQRKVHILLCGLTNDGSIGDAITHSMDKLRKTFSNNIAPQYIGSFDSLTGAQCNAATILRYVDNMKASADDTVLVYYLGHGAYNSTASQGDPSRGHLFEIPSGDLPREELYKRMQAKSARLTALITDTCNVASVVRPKLRFEVRTKTTTIMGFTSMERLMLFHRGQVDINASSRDQYSWFTAGYGGWFSNSFCNVVSGQSDWQSLFGRVSTAANEAFHQRKEMILANPGDTDAKSRQNLSMQVDMNPAAFRLIVNPDPFAEKPPAGMRAIESEFEVEVAVSQ